MAFSPTNLGAEGAAEIKVALVAVLAPCAEPGIGRKCTRQAANEKQAQEEETGLCAPKLRLLHQCVSISHSERSNRGLSSYNLGLLRLPSDAEGNCIRLFAVATGDASNEVHRLRHFFTMSAVIRGFKLQVQPSALVVLLDVLLACDQPPVFLASP